MAISPNGTRNGGRSTADRMGGPADYGSRGFEPVIVSEDPTPTPRYSVSFLGGFRCNGPHDPVEPSVGTQRIVAFLALCGSPLCRSFVAGSLWPEVNEASARAALRKQLWRLGASHPGLIEAERSFLRLGPSVTIDFHAEWDEFSHILNSPADQLAESELDRILQRGGGGLDLLPGWYEDWVIVEQERWRQLRVHALERASELYRAAGRWSAAVDAALAATAADPFRESAVRLLIEAFVAEGNVLAAARWYEVFRARLIKELGVDVGSEFSEWLDTVAARNVDIATISR